ncbi:MAG: NAD(P)/FAD-dependent oxidoreductase [Deinococcota bacterium]
MPTQYDVVIVGGSNAGLSAALILGRARRKVLIVDSQQPRNAPAQHAHGFFTQDGTPPDQLRELGKAQLEPYDVDIQYGLVTNISGENLAFSLTLDTGEVINAHKVILATGVQDDTSILPGLSELWGARAYTCPYCHGWEVRDQPLAVITSGQEAYPYASFLTNWSQRLTVCTNSGELDSEARGKLTQQHNLTIIDTPITQLSASKTEASVQFSDTTELTVQGIFVRPPMRLTAASLLTQLGCTLSECGSYVVTDDSGQTTIPGVYAVGDMASPGHAVILAAASGAQAAYMLNHHFVSEQQALSLAS